MLLIQVFVVHFLSFILPSVQRNLIIERSQQQSEELQDKLGKATVITQQSNEYIKVNGILFYCRKSRHN